MGYLKFQAERCIGDRIKTIYIERLGDLIGEIFLSPTGNCQVASINSFEPIIEGLGYTTDLKLMLNVRTSKPENIDNELINHLRVEFSKIFYCCGKNLVLIDVHAYITHLVKFLFKEAIILESPYTSTNGSSMVIFLIKTK